MKQAALESLFIHVLFLGLFLFVFYLKKDGPETVIVDIPVVVKAPEVEPEKKEEAPEKPKALLEKIPIRSVNQKKDQPKSQKKAREVYGVNRQSLTDESASNAQGLAAKMGNTLAKEEDQIKLTKDDEDYLPAPTEDYLVEEMPQVLEVVKPDYPQEAKEKKLEGQVVMNLLIDESGKVRSVTVIEGDEIFFETAKVAMKKFKFRPGRINGKPVVVQIRYVLKFQLEY